MSASRATNVSRYLKGSMSLEAKHAHSMRIMKSVCICLSTLSNLSYDIHLFFVHGRSLNNVDIHIFCVYTKIWLLIKVVSAL